MTGTMIKAVVAMIVCTFVMFVVYFGMGLVVDNFLFFTSQFTFAQGGIGQKLLPVTMRMFNWFYLLGGFLIVVIVVWVGKIMFFGNKYEDEEVMDVRRRRF